MKALKQRAKVALTLLTRRFKFRKVNIVRHRTGWCATFRNAQPSKLALHDKTACGYVVHLRWGSDVGIPDCPDCLKVMARRRENRSRKR